eukprot:scaffold1222_cov317-Pavlova_lutheri.AAC.24
MPLRDTGPDVRSNPIPLAGSVELDSREIRIRGPPAGVPGCSRGGSKFETAMEWSMSIRNQPGTSQQAKMPQRKGASATGKGLAIGQDMQGKRLARDGREEGTVQDLVHRKSQIDREIREVQNQIYELESRLLDELKQTESETGHFVGLLAESWQRNVVLPEERLFSNSSVY